MTGFITSNDVDPDFIRRKLQEIQTFKIKSSIILDVSCKARYIYNPSGDINVAFIDYGAKKSLLASLAKRGCRVTVYPAGTMSQEITDNGFDAVFLSNGPGDPNNYTYQITQIKQLIGKTKLFGVGLGCQLLALASDAKVYKLKYGHRGSNQPVINIENNKVMMTSQNHGYAINSENLTKFMRPTHKNLNDDTLEGFEITSLGVYAVQFEPEGAPGPCESSIILDEWVNIMKRETKINEVRNER